jgi:hypothetical protein
MKNTLKIKPELEPGKLLTIKRDEQNRRVYLLRLENWEGTDISCELTQAEIKEMVGGLTDE